MVGTLSAGISGAMTTREEATARAWPGSQRQSRSLTEAFKRGRAAFNEWHLTEGERTTVSGLATGMDGGAPQRDRTEGEQVWGP